MKLKVMLGKIKYEAVIFAVLSAQILVRIDWAHPVTTNFLSFYLLDYKVGFVSRAFIGSLVTLLTEKVTEKWLTGFIIITFFVVYFLLSLIFGKLIRSAEGDLKQTVIFLTAIYLFTCFSGRVLLDNVGLLDIYWFLYALLAIVCIKNKYVKWLIPLFCFAGLATHYGFALTFLPLLFVLMVYEIFNRKYKSDIILAVISFLTAVCSSVYFVFFANRFLRLDSDGTYKYLSGKANFPVWRAYADAYLFYTYSLDGKKFTGVSDFLKILKETAFESLRFSLYLKIFMLMLPLFMLLYFLWMNSFKFSSKKSEKFVFILCMALPLPVLPSFVFSTDMPRFLGEILIVQFMMLFYFIFDKNEVLLASLKKAETFLKKYPMLLMLLFIFSLSAVFFK